ncbi:PITH domain-containing protein [Boeremia exigua]|uniref:PITH domain-containing protein n=1 Tax=Boeremia exigua TaxID=749465 RepID=UPI001E8E9894|nr:PITH domain-containing protein [Boeremia exigua]KAH6629827.1 PITH domain-containing protein [Boeremia exigua]
MSGSVEISGAPQLSQLISASRIVVLNFYNEDNQSSKAIAPVYDQLSEKLSRPNRITFARVSVKKQAQIAESYNITNTPTFVIFKAGQQIRKFSGSNPKHLSDAIKSLAQEAESDGGAGGFGEAGSSSGGPWRGAGLPRGYTDVTESVDVRGLDLLNADSDFAGVRTLFENTKPSSLSKGKASADTKDWVESDVDNQLMLYVPFTSTLKVHTIHITSNPPVDEDDDEVPVRPKTISIWTNRQHNLGFEEAEDIPATQTIELKESDWDKETGTAKLELRFVKFQNVYSLVLFVQDGDGDSEKTRIDRIHFIGESGEKRDMGKLEKIGDDS